MNEGAGPAQSTAGPIPATGEDPWTSVKNGGMFPRKQAAGRDGRQVTR